MRMDNKLDWLRNLTAYCLMIAVFAATSLIASAAPDKKVSMGELIVSGSSVDGNEPSVLLNGEKALSGRTFFSSGTIATPESATATVKLGNLGSVTLAPNTVLNLSFDENSISGTLSAGNVKVSNSEGVNVKIQTTKGVVENQAKAGEVLNVNADAMPAPDDDDGAVSDSSQLALVLVFAGVVAGTVVYVLTRGGDDQVPPVVSPTS
ncbi:MAG: hypothetical protein R2747_18630 [Pyrinomonadaceae bacterium]